MSVPVKAEAVATEVAETETSSLGDEDDCNIFELIANIDISRANNPRLYVRKYADQEAEIVQNIHGFVRAMLLAKNEISQATKSALKIALCMASSIAEIKKALTDGLSNTAIENKDEWASLCEEVNEFLLSITEFSVYDYSDAGSEEEDEEGTDDEDDEDDEDDAGDDNDAGDGVVKKSQLHYHYRVDADPRINEGAGRSLARIVALQTGHPGPRSFRGRGGRGGFYHQGGAFRN